MIFARVYAFWRVFGRFAAFCDVSKCAEMC